MHLGSLQRVLWELLNQKRYLLVLDDVWNDDQDKWSQLRDVLACGLSGSSIIVTTRLKKVAEIMRTLPPHYLTGLSEEHCWMLLRERAFGQGNKELSPKLEAIGRQIVNKCSGVPLAAKALGGLLRFKRTEKEWIYVKESEMWELPEEENLILPTLRLSYHHLPLALRQCFAYCAVFPKDSRIQKEELIFLWMAHGYISSKRVMEVEDVGEEICNELVLRSLLQCDTDPDTNKPTLIMHDLVHDLARSILENEIPRTQVLRNVRNASYSKIRQVNLRRKLMAFPTSNKPEMDMSFVLTNFCRLRILDASWTGVVDFPRALGKLKHLRHLNLSGTGIRTLPKSLCSLLNLQVLNLDDCKELVALPKKMRYLVNLRHLYLESCTSLKEMPSKIGKLIGLRTLSVFIVGRNRGNRFEELECLKLCGNLKIRHLERVENPTDAKKANLAEKENLRVLWLLWECEKIALKSGGEQIDEKVLEALEPHRNLEYLVIKGFAGRCFPVWMSSSTLDKVVDIYILDCRNCSHLPQLGNLPHLKSLLIRNVAGIEYIIEDPSISVRVRQYFPSLETLHLKSLPNLKGIHRNLIVCYNTKVILTRYL
ncbi:PREDICTED: putative disease resistance protein RGA3 [Erythranthe guttata]|nr:PREDICTED: putative disease resistance protein RGA3 [Erythranthe guttata]|eukprot:XP_012856984.1 PREDICTED: putative disease resistance protein RGA3 [Erythranthe guttata]